MARVTINDIIRKTGYSKSTVSYALNGKPGVGEKARQEIVNCAKELGFTPNIFAQNLSVNSYKTIGVILRDLTNPFYANVFGVIDQFCEKHNYDTIFYNLAGDKNRVKTALSLMKGKMVSGIILDFFGSDDLIADDLKQLNIPIVIFGLCTGYNVSCVEADDVQGAIQAVNYAHKSGHNDIFFITDRTNDIFNDRRGEAIRNRLKELNLEFEDHIITISKETCANTIINKCPLNSVLICYNDIVACSVISELMKEKKYVPEDYSVIGFDNLQIIPYSLTSVDIPQHDMALEAAKLLFDEIEGKETKKVKLKSSLVIRDSVKEM